MKTRAVLLWLLASLLAISVVADYPLLALAIGMLGGIIMGIMLVIDSGQREK